MKDHSAAKEIAVLFVLTFAIVAFFRWGHWTFNPRPAEESCIKWMSGQRILVGKGVLLDNHWTIREQEFTSFKFTDIERLGNKFKAWVEFELRCGKKGLWVQAIIEYEINPKEETLVFHGFTPETVLKRGDW